MSLFIRHDHEGNIGSAIKVNVMAEGLDHPYGDLKENESVLEVEVTPELEALYCHEIAEQYRVDLEQKNLKKKD